MAGRGSRTALKDQQDAQDAADALEAEALEQAALDGADEGTAEPDGDGITEEWVADLLDGAPEDGDGISDGEAEDGDVPEDGDAPEEPVSVFVKVEPPEGARGAVAFKVDDALNAILEESFENKEWYSVPALHYGSTIGKTELYVRKSARLLGYGLSSKKYDTVLTFKAITPKNMG